MHVGPHATGRPGLGSVAARGRPALSAVRLAHETQRTFSIMTLSGVLKEPAKEKMVRKNGFLASIGSSISHRLGINMARLVILFVLCAAVMVTAMLTWIISKNVMDRSFDFMSAQLREDVTQGAVAELKGLLTRVSSASTAVYRSLDALGSSFVLPDVTTLLLPVAWGTFSTSRDISGIHMVTREGLFFGYRRDGPEVRLLGNREVVAVPAPPNDTLSVAYGYVPDPFTGKPSTDGPMVKMCAIGSCPTVMDPAVYIPPTIAPLSSPAWTLGRGITRGSMKMNMAISSALEPTLSVYSSFKDERGEQLAVMSISALSSQLKAFLQATSVVRVFHGRVFIAEGARLNILSASNGTMYTPAAAPGLRPTLASAVNSSDEVTREAARHMNETFGSELFGRTIQTHAPLGTHGVHYLQSLPLTFEGLQLVVILAVAREEFRGEIEESRRQGLIIAMVIVIVMFVVGGLAMCLSTSCISRKLSDQEKGLGEAAAANQALKDQLQTLTQVYPDDWPKIDMGTPLEKLTAIIKSLQPGRFLSHAQVQQMQALVTADDLHKPQFLATIQPDNNYDTRGTGLSVRGQVDRETGSWISLLTTGRRGSNVRQESPHCPNSSPATAGGRSQLPADLLISLKQSSLVLDAAEAGLLPPTLAMWEGMLKSVPLTSSALGEDGDMAAAGEHEAGGKWARKMLSPRAFHHRPALATALDLSTDNPADQVGPPNGLGRPLNASLDECARFFCPHRERGNPPSFCSMSHIFTPVMCALHMGEAPCPSEFAHPSRPAPALAPRKSAGLFGLWEAAVAGSLGAQPAHSPPPSSPASPHVVDVLTTVMTEPQRRQAAELRGLGSWEFDALALANVTEGDLAVPLVGYSLFLRMGLLLEFGISEQKLANFLLVVSRGMGHIPYHNAAHVVDVTANLFHILDHSGVGDHLRGIDKLAALCAALIHDYRHPGVNNDFLSRTREELATVYNDQSPLENYHLAEAFYLLYTKDECNFLEVLSEEDFMEVRRVVIEVVLATDMKRHFGVLDAFKARVSQELPWDPDRDSDRILLLQLALKPCRQATADPRGVVASSQRGVLPAGR
eukprot:jgi/Mesvir1/27903/Mv03418-RA.2